MAKAIFNPNGLTRGFAIFPKHGDRMATVREAVHDGDTITVDAAGSFSIRFLGIDTPEVSLEYPTLPGDPRSGTFRSVDAFADYLRDPFSPTDPDSQAFSQALGPGLVAYLRTKLSPHTTANHRSYAIAAQRELETMVAFDVNERLDHGEHFRFFMAFAYEVMDRYGRLLCYVDRDSTPSERAGRLTYNERMLQSGLALPYFIIWPNINPFRRQGSLRDAIPPPDEFKAFVDGDRRLSEARTFVSEARNAHVGVFDGH